MLAFEHEGGNLMGYQVVLEDLDEAAGAAAELAEHGAAIDVAGAVERAPAGLVGSRAERKLHALARTMRDNTTELASDTRTYGNNLSNAAEYYRAHEERARETIERLAGDRAAGLDGRNG